jgi:hypothetical protein
MSTMDVHGCSLPGDQFCVLFLNEMKGPASFFRESSWEGEDRGFGSTPPEAGESPSGSKERGRTMFSLATWSIVLALTPLVLSAAWKLVFGISHAITLGFTEAYEYGDGWGSPPTLNFNHPSGCVAVANRRLSPLKEQR